MSFPYRGKTQNMPSPEAPEIRLLKEAYSAFNSRDIDSALSAMQPDVVWANGMEGGYVHGHAGVRAYWTRQWSMINPSVEPLSFQSDSAGHILVDVHGIVRDLSGKTLLDHSVRHRYTMRNGLVQKMDICEPSRANAEN
jgi:hypothetical protein